METTRRDMLKIAGAAAGVTAAMATGINLVNAQAAGTQPAPAPAPAQAGELRGEMWYRKLGKTGAVVSVVGLGGHHIGIPAEDEGIRIMHAAIDRGINFFDNSWDYHNGASEIRMGKALAGGKRDKVFLMTKINGRTKQKAAEELNECLKRLQTDHLDLIQHHAIEPADDAEKILGGAEGAHAALVEAQKAGKVRFIGFTGHRDPAVHLRFYRTAQKHGIRFETVQMPLNVMDAHYKSFEQIMVPVLVKNEVGVLGMKPMGMGSILKSKTVKPIECLHYAMNLPTSVVITGIDSMQVLEQALEAAKTFKPLTKEEVAALLAKTKEAAKDGQFEPFKVSENYHRDHREAMEWVV